MKKNILAIVSLSLIIISCSKYLQPVKKIPSNTKAISLSDYNLYILQLVLDEVKSSDPLKKLYPRIANITSKKDELICEELYLLVDKNERHCYYLSSFSHKYIFEDGVFNNRNYNNAYYLNDIDFVFYGEIKDSIITFRNQAMIGPNTKKDINISFYKTSDSIQFIRITNDNPSKRERDNKESVLISDIFNIDFTFIKSQRFMKYRNSYCVEGEVDSVNFFCNDVYFKTDIPNYKYIKLKDRFKY
ncbi:hypothetical protein Q4Q35_05685 [Flavivirga aquimarina]|uniref:Lipoprotein n=1 Tax=Flavivirga aquimarina TaxID=2027862 RepID=A0ABT8W844_9FLAO|nr:hypothetical protein [Flavivirga aquimarina]MDO5969291.1 hypothetical protein [Flavivirga aquimarina]